MALSSLPSLFGSCLGCLVLVAGFIGWVLPVVFKYLEKQAHAGALGKQMAALMNEDAKNEVRRRQER
jgi:hypothetical protein